MNRRKIAMKGKNQGPNSKDEKVITLFETDIHIVAYRIKRDLFGVRWIIGRLHAKIRGKNQKIRELSAFTPFPDRLTDIVAYREAIYYISDVLWFIGS